MFKKIRGFFASLKNKFKSLFISKKVEQDFIMPMPGDVLQLADGSIKVVAYSGFDEEGFLDLRFFLDPKVTVSRKGRAVHVICISKKGEPWPPEEGSELYRGSDLIYPISNWKISFVSWLNSLVLK